MNFFPKQNTKLILFTTLNMHYTFMGAKDLVNFDRTINDDCRQMILKTAPDCVSSGLQYRM